MSIDAEKETQTENEQEESLVQVYEVGYHLLPTLPEEKLASEVSVIKEVIEKHGGVFISEDYPKDIALAYSMSKVEETSKRTYDRAYFGWIKFEVSPDVVNEIKDELEENASILRFLIVKTVRENTLYTSKLAAAKKEAEIAAKKPADAEGTDTAKSGDEDISEEEIDKSIDELVIE